MLKIRQLREKSGLSQDQMVAKTGIPKRSYVNYESGSTDIPLKKLQDVASALGVSIADLVDEKKEYFGAKESETNYSRPEISSMIVDSENRIRKDLAAITEGMTHNFEVISKGVMRGLQDQQKIIDFIDKIDVEKINEATVKLEVFLKG